MPPKTRRAVSHVVDDVQPAVTAPTRRPRGTRQPVAVPAPESEAPQPPSRAPDPVMLQPSSAPSGGVGTHKLLRYLLRPSRQWQM